MKNKEKSKFESEYIKDIRVRYFCDNDIFEITEEDFRKNYPKLEEDYLAEIGKIDTNYKLQNPLKKNLNGSYSTEFEQRGENFIVEFNPLKKLNNSFDGLFKRIKKDKEKRPEFKGNKRDFVKKITDYEFGDTGSGNPVSVMTEVVNIFAYFLRTIKPEYFSFQTHDSNRNKLYKMFAKKMSNQMNDYQYMEQNSRPNLSVFKLK